MSWLMLQTHLECIPHPCHMYTQCFSTLICRGWAYGCTLTLLRLCRPGVEFWKIGVGRSLSDAVMSFKAPNPLGVHPTSMSYVYKVIQHLDIPWMGIWVYPYTGTHPTWLIFCGAVSLVESTWCDYVMVEAEGHLKLIPTSILHIIYKVFEHLDTLSILTKAKNWSIKLNCYK